MKIPRKKLRQVNEKKDMRENLKKTDTKDAKNQNKKERS